MQFIEKHSRFSKGALKKIGKMFMPIYYIKKEKQIQTDSFI